MAATGPPSNAVTQFSAVLETPWRAGFVLPILTLMLYEGRSGGWSGTIHINPRRTLPEDALQTLMADGLVPGTAATVKLVIAGSTGHAGVAARVWPSVVTSVNCTTSSDVNSADAVCVVTFRDPVTYLRNRPIWTAFADCPLSEMVGGALSVAAGGDGKPTRMPLLPGLSAIQLEESVRDELAAIPYAIAAGEPFGYWLNRVFGRLGTRLEMLGEPSGVLKASVVDCVPTKTVLNRDGGVDMTFDPDLPASATNLTLSGLDASSGILRRGGMLDNPSGGGVRRFGPPGALESVTIASETDVQEAEFRAGFPQTNRRLSQVRTTITSCQPGLLPGRVVNLRAPANLDVGADSDGPHHEADQEGYLSILGARRWQVIDVAHLFLQGRYWNQASFEKIGLAWHPGLPDEQGPVIVSGVVDDGNADAGELIDRDRLGRVPIRFPFVVDVESEGAGDDLAATGDAPDTPWPPCVPLSPIAPGAGNLHGFVSDHRQGDWCRVAVVNPLYAEIVGFCHRDDRYLSERVRDATVGIVVREGEDEWRGMVFRPDEDLEDELEPDDE
ncbi:MAG: hypothetical protein OXH15_05050 [Gammaproteobacteria bacterium]|nr:hypothetical protein [Gammaproteobacteria bacterium]